MPPDTSDSNTSPNAGYQPDIVARAEQAIDATGSVRLAISNALVTIKKQLYGKGPVKAKTYLNDNYVFSVLEGGLTRNEETLLEAGEHPPVRDHPPPLPEAVAGAVTPPGEEGPRRGGAGQPHPKRVRPGGALRDL